MKTESAAHSPYLRPVPSTRSSQTRRSGGAPSFVDKLQAMSIRGLSRMFDDREQLFVFRLRRTDRGVIREGVSLRYTAITMLGLAHVPAQSVVTVLGRTPLQDVCARLITRATQSDNLGDVALSLWAGCENGVGDLDAAVSRLKGFRPAQQQYPVVEVAWTLSALSEVSRAGVEPFRDAVAERLMSAYRPHSKLFPHVIGASGARSHVSCFADLIYPIQALAKYAAATGNRRALDIASAAARHLCKLQGDAGQWWWHYDYRTGRVIERYPVYAIHQDAMGPMGLMALMDAGGPDCSREIQRGLDWLASATELGGATLIDDGADLIWRKVARREPPKAVRYLQAAASGLHPSLRVPAVDAFFPACVIDYEDRPYHLGWLLYAWRASGAITRSRPLGA